MQTMALPDVTTAEQLLALPDDGMRYELLNGELTAMSPVNFDHGHTLCQLVFLLKAHLKKQPTGYALTETGFILRRSPDLVVAPDLAYVKKEDASEPGTRGFVTVTPQLTAEVIQPDDRYVTINKKTAAYLQAGVQLVLIIDPWSHTVTAHRSTRDTTVLHEDDTLDASDVVPGWTLSIASLFER